MSTTLTESHLLEDDKTMPSAIGAGIDEGRLQFLLSPKPKLAETEDDGSEQAPTEKRNGGDESEEQKQKQGGVCECKGGECEREGEGESESEEDDYNKEYFKRVSAIHGREIGPGTMDCGRGAIDDDDSDDDGNLSEMYHALGIAEIHGGTDPVLCCPYPFNALDFKQDTKLYNGLKVFGGIAVDYFTSVYNYGEACFQDIEKLTSCNASCQHCFVILKAIDPSDRVWKIVLRGLLPPEGFAEADPREFRLRQYSYA